MCPHQRDLRGEQPMNTCPPSPVRHMRLVERFASKLFKSIKKVRGYARHRKAAYGEWRAKNHVLCASGQICISIAGTAYTRQVMERLRKVTQHMCDTS
jgi:hypothetical protein